MRNTYVFLYLFFVLSGNSFGFDKQENHLLLEKRIESVIESGTLAEIEAALSEHKFFNQTEQNNTFFALLETAVKRSAKPSEEKIVIGAINAVFKRHQLFEFQLRYYYGNKFYSLFESAAKHGNIAVLDYVIKKCTSNLRYLECYKVPCLYFGIPLHTMTLYFFPNSYFFKNLVFLPFVLYGYYKNNIQYAEENNFNYYKKERESALREAARNGHKNIVGYLLESPHNIPEYSEEIKLEIKNIIESNDRILIKSAFSISNQSAFISVAKKNESTETDEKGSEKKPDDDYVLVDKKAV
jgi:hypothetical protein